MSLGIDYVTGPPVDALKSTGVTFVCRYLSFVNDLTKVKLLSANEAKAYGQAGIAIVSNYEWYATRAIEGAASGIQDAQIARDQHAACGGPADRPIYFSVDADVAGDQVADYFKGVASVIGLQRTGAYGSYRVLKYLFDHGLITWGWQTYAWSGDQWEPRAHIQQYDNGQTLAGHSVDYDRSMTSDFGQWFPQAQGGTTTITLNSSGEIIDVQEADQFQPAKSQFECGFFACAMARSMSKPGEAPTLTMQQVIADAEQWYAQYDGNNTITNTDGMTLQQLYSLLVQIGLHYQAIAVDINTVKTWVEVGYPCVIAITEVSVRDMALGDTNPYPWTPAGTHIILVTGMASDGNVLVRDSANCTSLYNPNSLRPGPRKYNASALRLVSATAVVPPWMPRPTSATTPPTPIEGDLPLLQLTDPMGKFFTATADNRWHCPSKNVDIAFALLSFYRQYNGVFGLPITNEIYLQQYPGVALQYCERALMAYDPADASGKRLIDSPPGAGSCYLLHIDSGMGQQALAKPLLATLQSQVDSLTAQVASLTSELDAAKAQPTTDTSALEQQISDLTAQVAAYKQAVASVEATIGALPK